jgi:hypothetical protein
MLPLYEFEARGLDEQIDLLMDFPDISQQELGKAMSKSVITIEGEAKPFVPVDRGLLRASLGSEVKYLGDMNIIGRVGSSLGDEEYPRVMELGRKPGGKMPPLDALEPWVKRVIRPDEKNLRSVTFLVARKIAKKGIAAREFMKKAWERSQARVDKYFDDALVRIAERISNGRH